ncbi:MAG: hypothetical protein ACLUE2_12375 [Bacteroides cellulosilyticus]
MNEAALKAFGYTKQEEAFVRGEQALWITSSMDGKIVEGGLSLMPVGTVIKDYYTKPSYSRKETRGIHRDTRLRWSTIPNSL